MATDPQRDGRIAIAGVPDEVIELHSKRAAEIDAEVERRGEDSYRARRVGARATRQAKEEGVEIELVGRWQGELASIGWPVERLAASIDDAAQKVGQPPKLTLKTVRRMLGEVLSGDGERARKKVFARRQVLVEVAPHLFGQDLDCSTRWLTAPCKTLRRFPLSGWPAPANSRTRSPQCSRPSMLSPAPSPGRWHAPTP